MVCTAEPSNEPEVKTLKGNNWIGCFSFDNVRNGENHAVGFYRVPV